MTNIKKDLVIFLEDNFSFATLKILKWEKSSLTHKFLFELKDKTTVESVLMCHDYGNSLCISSQVGCNMGCTFCESGRLKKVRDLNPDEMVLQIIHATQMLNKRIDSIVIMGIGEPFDNYENIMTFIHIINHPKSLALGSRHITVSTCGLVPKIYDFAKEGLQVNLAVSLHAPNDDLRNRLMPINKVYPLTKLVKAIKDYIDLTNRRVSIEYLLLDDINDHEQEALELVSLFRGMNIYINLIPYNETSKIDYRRSKKMQINNFYDILKKYNMNVTIRREFGKEVSAACGQLRASEEKL